MLISCQFCGQNPKLCNSFINTGLTPLLLNNFKKLRQRTTSLSVTVASVATTFAHTANNWPSPRWHQTLLLLLDHQRWRPPRRLIPQAANVANPSSSGHQLQPPRPILSPPANSLQWYPPSSSSSRWSSRDSSTSYLIWEILLLNSLVKCSPLTHPTWSRSAWCAWRDLRRPASPRVRKS